MTVTIRPIHPSDYRPVISVIDDWWGGRHMADNLPRLFFEHFTETCFAAERDGELAGFLVGFTSQARPGEAYIHFVGVHPGERGRGLGRRLYEHFFAAATARGCELVRAITAPVNRGSVRFHQRMGLDIEPATHRPAASRQRPATTAMGKTACGSSRAWPVDTTPHQSPPTFVGEPSTDDRRRQACL